MGFRETAFAACERIANRGESPTVELVRAELGCGTYTRITPAVREWKELHSTATGPSSELVEHGQEEASALPAAVQKIRDALAAAVESLPAACTAAIAETAATERRHARLELDAIRMATETDLEQARRAAADAQSECDALRSEMVGMTAAAVQRDEELAKLHQAVDGQVTRLEQMATALSQEKLAREAAEACSAEIDKQMYAAKTEAALEHDTAQRCQAEVSRLRSELADVSADLEAARKENAALTVEVAVERQRTLGECQRAERAETDAERSRAAAEAARDALARVALAEVEAVGHARPSGQKGADSQVTHASQHLRQIEPIPANGGERRSGKRSTQGAP